LEDPAGSRSWVLRADVVATVLDYGALLLDLDSKYFFQLNPAGWAVTQLFESPTSQAHALASARAWGAPEADLAAVRSLVESLVTFGLVEGAAADTAPVGEAPKSWTTPTLERQPEPLQRVIMSAFDPSIPLAE
jgi:hypothetical protein